MPWEPRQQRAIAARLSREGKSDAEISAFFRRHGHGRKRRKRRMADNLRGAR